ncbi:MAG: aldo/keto reductase [Halioglobus sp.]|nr:aldo/keto reductase [Halioglobus sp.]
MMQYRRLGRTELSVSAVGVGAWQLAGVWGKSFEQSEVDSILSRAGELGINFIDTAECYGPDHLSERLIGSAITHQRERWIIATKFGHNPGNDLGDENYGAAQVKIQLEDSLRALRTDYIDLYQLHSAPDENFDNDDLWTMLNKQVEAGKIRFLGNSLGRPKMQQQVSRSREFGISVLQTAYNAITRRAAKFVFPVASEMDLGIIARAPLAMGLLSGKYQREHVFDDVRALFLPKNNLNERLDAAHEALKAKPPGMDAATWAIAWCLQNPQVGTVIPGIKSLAQLELNALAGMVITA